MQLNKILTNVELAKLENFEFRRDYPQKLRMRNSFFVKMFENILNYKIIPIGRKLRPDGNPIIVWLTAVQHGETIIKYQWYYFTKQETLEDLGIP